MSVYEDGAAAFRAGLPLEACPYKDSEQYGNQRRIWIAGWMDAAHGVA